MFVANVVVDYDFTMDIQFVNEHDVFHSELPEVCLERIWLVLLLLVNYG